MLNKDSMCGRWDFSLTSEMCFSDWKCESYIKAAEFLGDTVEDWGCGLGWAEKYFKNYTGIDGSLGYVKEQTDLVHYTSDVDNILIRQVIEHDYKWDKILENAIKSFRKKLCLIINTPFVKKTRVGHLHPFVKADGTIVKGFDKPEMYFNKQDILDFFPPDKFKLREESIPVEQGYHRDWILYVEKI